MGLAAIARLAVVAGAVAIAAGPALACSCGGTFPGKHAWEIAQKEVQASAAVFEGTPVRFEPRWDVLDAKDGSLIPTGVPLENATLKEWPHMVVTFRVQRAYKGDLGSEVQVATGMGGGDCGAVFSPGLTYLVYAGATFDVLATSMCSPGGWIGSPRLATALRYLRNEHPIPSDLKYLPRGHVEEPNPEERQRKRRDFENRYSSATGKICGAVTGKGVRDLTGGTVSFLSTAGHSPSAFPAANVSQDGSFCSGPLGPGKYYLHFVGGYEEDRPSFVFYPGISDRAKATAIEVTAGQTRSNIAFRVPRQDTYSVHGFLWIQDKAALTRERVSVRLISRDATLQTCYSQEVNLLGSFPLPGLRYFKFKNVLPGHYVAFASVQFDRRWLTRKVEVNVTTHMKFISLELVHVKPLAR
jgi:hypothetical protein